MEGGMVHEAIQFTIGGKINRAYVSCKGGTRTSSIHSHLGRPNSAGCSLAQEGGTQSRYLPPLRKDEQCKTLLGLGRRYPNSDLQATVTECLMVASSVSQKEGVPLRRLMRLGHNDGKRDGPDHKGKEREK